MGAINKKALYQHWVHSHEEDTEAGQVYRPATYTFPPSRGRMSFELHPDGSLNETVIGPDDRLETIRGTWRLDDKNRLHVFHKSNPDATRIIEILSADRDRLVVKR